MAYLDYEYEQNATLSSIAAYYNVSVEDLARVNNLQQPVDMNAKLTNIPGLTGRIIIPDIFNGRESFENSDRTGIQRIDVSQATRPTQARPRNAFTNRVGYSVESDCWIEVFNVGTYYFPGYPESFSDTRQSNFTSQNPLGRSEPFQIYQNSGPRTVSVTFKMHREMLDDSRTAGMSNPPGEGKIDLLVTALQASTYPLGYMSHIPPKVRLVIGNSCDITGVISGTVSTDWSDTIIDGRYQMVSVSFSVTEATGNPITANEFTRVSGRTFTSR